MQAAGAAGSASGPRYGVHAHGYLRQDYDGVRGRFLAEFSTRDRQTSRVEQMQAVAPDRHRQHIAQLVRGLAIGLDQQRLPEASPTWTKISAPRYSTSDTSPSATRSPSRPMTTCSGPHRQARSGRPGGDATLRNPASCACPPCATASTMFILGEPMKVGNEPVAGKVVELVGRADLLDIAGVQHGRCGSPWSSLRPGRA